VTPITPKAVPAETATDPALPVAETPVTGVFAFADVVTVPALEEAETPDTTTLALADTVMLPGKAVAETPVTEVLAFADVATTPNEPVATTPVTGTLALADVATVPEEPVADTPVTGTFAFADVATVPVEPVADTPVTGVLALPDVATVPSDPVAVTPITEVLANPFATTEPEEPVAVTPVTSTLTDVASSSPHGPSPHPSRPQPVTALVSSPCAPAPVITPRRAGADTLRSEDVAIVTDPADAVAETPVEEVVTPVPSVTVASTTAAVPEVPVTSTFTPKASRNAAATTTCRALAEAVSVRFPVAPAVALRASPMASEPSAPVVLLLSARSCHVPAIGFAVWLELVPLDVVGSVAASKFVTETARAPQNPTTIRSSAFCVVRPATLTDVAAAASVALVEVTRTSAAAAGLR
jgi:hypothetical protein